MAVCSEIHTLNSRLLAI